MTASGATLTFVTRELSGRISLRSSRTCARAIPYSAGACVDQLDQGLRRRMSWSRSSGRHSHYPG